MSFVPTPSATSVYTYTQYLGRNSLRHTKRLLPKGTASRLLQSWVASYAAMAFLASRLVYIEPRLHDCLHGDTVEWIHFLYIIAFLGDLPSGLDHIVQLLIIGFFSSGTSNVFEIVACSKSTPLRLLLVPLCEKRDMQFGHF